MIIGMIGSTPAQPDDRGRFAQQTATTIPGVRDGTHHDVRAGPHRRPARLRDADRRHQRQGQYAGHRRAMAAVRRARPRCASSAARRATSGPRRFRASAPCATEFSRAAELRTASPRREPKIRCSAALRSYTRRTWLCWRRVHRQGRCTMLDSKADSGRLGHDGARSRSFRTALWAAVRSSPMTHPRCW